MRQGETQRADIRPGPLLWRGYWTWADQKLDIQVRFVGRGPAASRAEIARMASDQGLPIAWSEQVHSGTVVEARPGKSGRGDALITRRRGLGLTVVAADCVPLLLGSQRIVSAVHAGWRGIVAGIVPTTLESLGEPCNRLIAWIGPAIGPCCYEVGEEVAAAVARVSSGSVMLAGPRGRPHLDLPTAVQAQLEAAGISEVRRIGCCTRCADRRLWSYRRDGKGTGRNLALIWLSPPASAGPGGS